MEVKFKKVSGSLVVKISGEIDSESAKELRRKIDVEYDCTGARDIVFDFGLVGFMDSSGIGMIIGRYKRAAALGGEIKIYGANNTVKRIIELSGLGRVVRLCRNEQEAIGAMSKND